jgi:hypothetical protein
VEKLGPIGHPAIRKILVAKQVSKSFSFVNLEFQHLAFMLILLSILRGGAKCATGHRAPEGEVTEKGLEVLTTSKKRKADSPEVTGPAEKKQKGDSPQTVATQGEMTAKDDKSISTKGAKTIVATTKATEVAKTKAAEAAQAKAVKEADTAKAETASQEAEASLARKGKAPTTVLALRQQAKDG